MTSLWVINPSLKTPIFFPLDYTLKHSTEADGACAPLSETESDGKTPTILNVPNIRFSLDGALRKFRTLFPILWEPELDKYECAPGVYLLSCKDAVRERQGRYGFTVRRCNICEKIFSSTNLINHHYYDDKPLPLQMADVQLYVGPNWMFHEYGWYCCVLVKYAVSFQHSQSEDFQSD